jgi:hypothetical protein
MSVEILLIVIGLIPTIAAWRAWGSRDRASLDGARKSLFMTGLVGASLALAVYSVFVIYAYRIHGFGTNFSGMLRWARPGFWVSLLALLLVMAGRGRSRVFGLVSSLVVLILWIIPVWGM